MKVLRIYAAIAIAMLAVAACGDDQKVDPPQGGATASVRIRAVYAGDGGLSSRADATPVASGTPLSLQPGHIFFVTGGDLEIFHHFGLDVEAGSRTVTRADLLAGELVLDEILLEANVCVIISNDAAARIGGPNGITGNLEGTNLNDVMAMTMNVSDINTPSGDVSAVPLAGYGVAVAQKGTTATNGTAYDQSFTVEMEPGASRIQIAKISGTDYDYTDGRGTPRTISIDGFTVSGIFVNNFYPQADLNGGYPLPIVNHGTETAGYSTAESAPYSADGPGYKLADEGFDGVAVASSASPANGVWAYNVFPTPADTPQDVPHIVIRFSEVVYSISGDDTPLTLNDVFLTVAGIRHGTGGSVGDPGSAVTSFDPGNIYTFGEIRFNVNDLLPFPEQEGTVVVDADVEIFYWIDNRIGTDL